MFIVNYGLELPGRRVYFVNHLQEPRPKLDESIKANANQNANTTRINIFNLYAVVYYDTQLEG